MKRQATHLEKIFTNHGSDTGLVHRIYKELSKLSSDWASLVAQRLRIRLPGGFPGGAVVENLPANAGDTGSSPGLGRSHMPWSD